MFSVKTYAVTLTYAEKEGVNAVTLVYKDVQDFLKRLRKKYKVRYIVAGEYGTAKGRAHWHVILFFKDKPWWPHLGVPWGKEETYPKVEENRRVLWDFWGIEVGKDKKTKKPIVDHKGFCYFQNPDWKGFQYVLKYVLKDASLDSTDGHLAMSKKPPLGYEFFDDLAKTHVEQAVVPRSFKYKLPGIRKDNGQEKVFMMQGVTRDNFMNRVKEGWLEKYGKEPFSEFYEEWDEKNYTVTYNDEELIRRLHHKDVMYIEPWKTYETTDKSQWLEMRYEGIDLIMHDMHDKAWFYAEDGQSWLEKDQKVVDHIKRRSKIISKRAFSEVQQEKRFRSEPLRLGT